MWKTVACMLLASCCLNNAKSQENKELVAVENLSCRDGSMIEAESWKVLVPENRSREDSSEISVAFLRVKSPLPNPGPPVFFLAGGPGGSGYAQVKQMVEGGGKNFFELVGGDVVGIDQRGVGLSEPNLETETTFRFDVTKPGDPEEMIKQIRTVCKEEALRWREKGVDLDGYNTVENADDIDAIRRALGYEKIVLWGGSYGTHLGMNVIRRHSEQIERALLTGPEGPDHTFKLPEDSQRALQQLSDLVAKDETLGKQIPDLMAMLSTVLDRLDKSPAYVNVDGQRIGVSKFDVQRMIARDLGTIRGSADALPGTIKEMHDGDFSQIAETLIKDRTESGIWSVMNMVMDCASGASAQRRQLIDQQAKSCLIGNAANFPHYELAASWGVKDLGNQFRSNFETDLPILFIVGNMDSRTPISNAKELSKGFSNAHLVVVNNAGHNDVPMGMPQLREIWSSFLRTGVANSATLDGPPIRFTDASAREDKPNQVHQLSKEELRAFVGEYKFSNGRVLSISAGKGGLVAAIPGKGGFKLWPTSDNAFRADTRDIPPLVFQRDESGKVVSFEGGGKSAMRIGQKFESVKLTLEQLKKFEGNYDYGPLGIMTIRLDGTKLLARIPGQEELEVRPLSGTELRWVRIDATLKFSDDSLSTADHRQNGRLFAVSKQKATRKDNR